MKTLIADAFPGSALEALKSMGMDVDYQPGLSAADIPAAIGPTEVLVVRSTRVTAEAIKAAPDLSLIVRAGAGVNTIDIGTASDRGIFVTNCPGKNSIAVAELAMGLIVAVDRRIPENAADFRAGIWNKGAYSKADGLAGTPLGIAGLGQIGLELAQRARAFHMPVRAWSRSLTPERAEQLGIGYCPDLDTLMESCGVVSLHMALNDATRGIISRERIGRMRQGAVLINTGRAELVDEDALVEALRAGSIRAGLDVFRDEPEGKNGSIRSALQDCPNLVVTHHIGASTTQAQEAVAAEAVRIIGEFRRSGSVINWVNRSPATPVRCQLVVRHQDKPGVLANVLRELKNAEINAEEIENVVFAGNKTASCTIRLSEEPAPVVLEAIRKRRDEVISARLLDLPRES
ncbi:MAG: hydroxyacid dehydrogenase [Spirochaetaceae bacterium]|nr:MAG: hydroxyacid dehydrogenase [Spirochaetaceae bacterium]